MKKLKLSILLLIASLLTACGNSGKSLIIDKTKYENYPAVFVSLMNAQILSVNTKKYKEQIKSIDADLWIEPNDPEISTIPGRNAKIAYLATEYKDLSKIPNYVHWGEKLEKRQIRGGNMFLVKTEHGNVFKVFINTFHKEGIDSYIKITFTEIKK